MVAFLGEFEHESIKMYPKIYRISCMEPANQAWGT
jgi:hypothetical protein